MKIKKWILSFFLDYFKYMTRVSYNEDAIFTDGPQIIPEPNLLFKTICTKCHWRRPGDYWLCKHPEAPITDFVTGEKDPAQINKMGRCKYYKHGVRS